MSKVICPEPGSQLTVGSVTCAAPASDGLGTQVVNLEWYKRRIAELTAELAAANERAEKAARERDQARKTNRHYENALYFPEIKPCAVQDGDDAVEINPLRIAEIIKRAEAAERRAEESAWAFDNLAVAFRVNILRLRTQTTHEEINAIVKAARSGEGKA